MSQETTTAAIDPTDSGDNALGLLASYFVLTKSVSSLYEIDFMAVPNATEIVSALDYTKSNVPFWEEGPANNFAARYTGSLWVETAGTYTLYLTSDDGSALYLDGVRVIDNDGAHATRERTVTLNLPAGMHTMEVVYFENGGAQTLELDWQGPDTDDTRRTIDGAALLQAAAPEDPVVDATLGLTAEYFMLSGSVSSLAEIDFTMAPSATGVVDALDYIKSDVAFWDGGPSDNFAARYTGSLNVENAGSYTLYLTSDDGSALYINGERVINNDGAHAAREEIVTLDLEAGAHTIEVVYFENGGQQVLELEWRGPDTFGTRQTISGDAFAQAAEPVSDDPTIDMPLGLTAEYFVLPSEVSWLSDIDFTATPDATGTVDALAYVRSDDAFWEGGPTDKFAARYTGALQVEIAGTYTLYLTSDDGSALYIDGTKVIDNDGEHGAREKTVTLDLAAGTHDIEVQYFENGGRQVLELDWQGPDTYGSRQTIDGAALVHATEPGQSDDVPPDPADDAPVYDGPVLEIETGVTATVSGGRVTTLAPSESNIVTLGILEQPAHGHASVNPDNSIAFVLTGSEHMGPLDFRYEVTDTNGAKTQHDVVLDVTPSIQEAGWGTGANFYMLEVGNDGNVVVEHGDVHRKVYLSPNGLTAADIAALESVSEATITEAWLESNPQYGGTEGMALHPDIGFDLWDRITKDASSNWLLLERGHAYSSSDLLPREFKGESALHPVYIGAWGTGSAPEINSALNSFRGNARNLVIQGVKINEGVKFLNDHENVLFDGVNLSGEENVFQGGTGLIIRGLTFRNTAFLDAWKSEVIDEDGDGFWDVFPSRMTAIFVKLTDGLLFDGVFLDHNGWAPDYAEDGNISGGHPPSMYSHNAYLQADTRDVTMRDSITMRGASYGVHFRGGAHIEDTLFLDNNIPFDVLGGEYDDAGPAGNYSLAHGNVVTSAGGRVAPQIGATDWGIRNEAYLTTLIENIVTHANDPDDPADTIAGENSLYSGRGADGIYFDDTIIYRWGDTGDHNIDGLNTTTLDQTTIQRYTADLLSVGTATIEDLAAHLRTLDPTAYALATADILEYFRTGFGLASTPRSTSETLRFVPDVNADGVRWDNRLNWDTGDLPGAVDGDSVDLGGNKVVFGGTVTLNDLTFGADGGLMVTHGRLDVSGVLTSDAGAKLDIDRAGQFWTNGATGTDALTLGVAGGRFVNTGLFDVPVTLTATGGQTILATSGGDFRVDAQSRVDISGATTRIGFDGNDDGMALLRFEPGAMLGFTSSEGELAVLKEFRSGAFGVAPAVQSGIDLGGVSLSLDLTDLIVGDTLVLIEVDEVIGTFDEVRVQGLGDRDAAVIVDYDADIVWLQLTEGTGEASISYDGTPDMVDTGYSALWELLDGDRGGVFDLFVP